MKVKRKAPSPERTIDKKHEKESPAIRPKRKRVRKEEESEGIDLCAKFVLNFKKQKKNQNKRR